MCNENRIVEHDGIKITILGNSIYEGANSIVYNCKYKGEKYVIKFFKGKKTRYKRFKTEPEKIERLNQLMPNFTPAVVYCFFPPYNTDFNENKFDERIFPFYILEKGEKYYFKGKSFEEKVNDLIEIAESIEKLHSQNCIHRDIKDLNIVKYSGLLTLIDLGTMKMPGIETLSEDDGKKMGSEGTIAPEMRNHAKYMQGYDDKKADIYSFGKVMWNVLTEKSYSNAFTTYENSNNSCRIVLPNLHKGIVSWLEKIINECTQETFYKRPSIEKVKQDLIYLKNNISNKRIWDNIKFVCLLEKIKNREYDGLLLNKKEKINKYSKECENIRLNISLNESEIEICNRELDLFSLLYDKKGFYYFIIEDTKICFFISEINITDTNVIIKCDKWKQELKEEYGEYYNDLDSYIRTQVLNANISPNIKEIYFESTIKLSDIIK